MSFVSHKHTSLLHVCCAALMALLLVLQFLPFWSCETQTVSILGYICEPLEFGDITVAIGDAVPDFVVNNIVLQPVLIFLLSLAGTVCCLIWRKNPLTALIPAACGLIGIWSFSTNPALQLGSNWGLHLLVCILILAAAVISVILNFQTIKAYWKSTR